MDRFNQYKKFKKSLNKEDKRILRNSIFFLRTAMTCAMTIEAKKKYKNFIDANGWADFYEIVMEICDELLLSNYSVFLTYIKLYIDEDDQAINYFDENYQTSFDWYFMELARLELNKKIK
jgi:hypothetical protein